MPSKPRLSKSKPGKLGVRQHFLSFFKKDLSHRYINILAKTIFAKSAKPSSHLRITYFGLNDWLKQEPQARRRPRRLIENTILKNDEPVEDANEDVGAPTS